MRSYSYSYNNLGNANGHAYHEVWDTGVLVAAFVHEDEARMYLLMKMRWSPEELNKAWLTAYNSALQGHHDEPVTMADLAVTTILDGHVYALMKKVAAKLEVLEPIA